MPGKLSWRAFCVDASDPKLCVKAKRSAGTKRTLTRGSMSSGAELGETLLVTKCRAPVRHWWFHVVKRNTKVDYIPNNAGLKQCR